MSSNSAPPARPTSHSPKARVVAPTGVPASMELEVGAGVPAWYRRLPPWLRRVAPPLTLAGLTLSLVAHLAFLMLAAVWLVGGGIGGSSAGTESGGRGVVGIAVMTEQELGQLMGEATEAAEVGVDAAVPTTGQLTVGVEALSVETAAIADAVGLAGGAGEIDATGAGVGAGSSIGDGEGLGLGGSGGGASFFGVTAQGRRFAYVCDISGSMEAGVGGDAQTTRLTVLKQELERSIRSLPGRSHFAVVLFSGQAEFLGKRREWVNASDAGKQWARRVIATLTTGGDTQPLPAFEQVFRLRPRPDAIYFMTDGEFDESVVTEILKLNATDKIPVHCITLISTEGQSLMQRIAELTGGTYKHVSSAP